MSSVWLLIRICRSIIATHENMPFDSKRTTSAGYRLPERNNVILNVQSEKEGLLKPQRKTRVQEDNNSSAERQPYDLAKRDEVWREIVRTEMRGVKEWERNWSFLKNYDYLGQPKQESPSSSHDPLYLNDLPNTANQIVGSRLSTPLARELIKMDNLLLWTGSRHKCKQDPDLIPY